MTISPPADSNDTKERLLLVKNIIHFIALLIHFKMKIPFVKMFDIMFGIRFHPKSRYKCTEQQSTDITNSTDKDDTELVHQCVFVFVCLCQT